MGGNGTYNLVNHAFSSNRCAVIIAGSCPCRSSRRPWPLLGSLSWSRCFSINTHFTQWTGHGAAIQYKNARFWGRHGWCVRRGFRKHEWITRMINNSSHHSAPWEITRRMLERESGADVGVPAPQLQSTMSCAPCVTVVHSCALPLHRGLGKIHAVTLRRRAVARLNRLVCNLTPGRAFAIALPTESLFKKERDESNAPDSVTPLQKRTQLSLRLRVPRFGSA